MKSFQLRWLVATLFYCVSSGLLAQPGSLDASFNPTDQGFGLGDGPNGNIYSVAYLPDGKVLIGGDFTSYNGTQRNRIARLNSDGRLDGTFNPGLGANAIIFSIAYQPDGKVLIGGWFSSYNSTGRNRIARLNSDGSLDGTFNPGTGADLSISSIAYQPDGKVLIGGTFTSYNGTPRNRIARLNSDGNLDGTFNPGTGANNSISAIAYQPDGKVLIGGWFSSYNGTTRNRIARLNSDGSLDDTFNPGTGADDLISSMAYQPDGKVLIGGWFANYNGTGRRNIARLNSDGSLDSTFNPGSGADNGIRSIAYQPDGKVLIGGLFADYNGTGRKNIARLNSDGSLDGTFNPGTRADGAIYSMAYQPDGKVLIGGWLSSYNGTARYQIARLNSDGSLDGTFNPIMGANDYIKSIAYQPDDKVLIAGNFTTYNGMARNRIARLNSDGSLDNTFNPGTGADSAIYSVAHQPDGKVLIGGNFYSYNGTARNRIARLNSDGTLDGTFNIGTGVDVILHYISSITYQSDGKVLIGGNLISYNGTARNRIARLNSNGTLDNTFNPGTVENDIIHIYSIIYQPDGKVLIGGTFSRYNGSTSNNIARLNSNGSLDGTFNPFPGTGANGTIASIAYQPDGKVLIVGSFSSYNGTRRNGLARLNSDGSLDDTFNPGTGANGSIASIAYQPDGKVLIGGFFTSYNGTARIRIARLNSDGSLDGTFNPGTGANIGIYCIANQPDGKVLIGGNFTGYNDIGRNRIARIDATSVITGAEELVNFTKNEITVTPNPVKKEFVVQLPGTGQKDVSIWSLTGLVLESTQTTKATLVLNARDYSAGIYVIRVHTANGYYHSKFIKE